MSLPDKRTVAQKWRARGFDCRVWHDQAGQPWDSSVRDIDQIFMLLEGNFELRMQTQTLKPAPGDEILVPAGTPYRLKVTGADTSWLYGARQ